MKLVVDVQYSENSALTGGILFDAWSSSIASQRLLSQECNIQEYEPGKFYKRELPCIIGLLKKHNVSPEIIIIDGYVFLDGEIEAGLGKYLYDALNNDTPIIGVAKKPFKDISSKYQIYRGKSEKPLYVTAVGIDTEKAKEKIQSMHGKNRIPTLLKNADQLCREIPF